MEITRKLKEIGQALESVIAREDLSITKNAWELNGLVGDVRDALMNYQVRTPKLFVCITSNNAPDLITARYPQGELQTDCKSYFFSTQQC
jgi:hypothetical protein